MKKADQIIKELGKFKALVEAVENAHEYAIEASKSKNTLDEMEKTIEAKKSEISKAQKVLEEVSKKCKFEVVESEKKSKHILSEVSDKVEQKKKDFAELEKAIQVKIKNADDELSGKIEVSAKIDEEISIKEANLKNLEKKIEELKSKLANFIG